jgi:assimilatory nitrate reductase catalytic subunit
LTRELLRSPGKFGLGQVPARVAPDATTGVVCGYCSTGCNLNVHLREGEAVNLTPATDYPVNLGMACPKGWEALAVLDAPDRATVPLLRGEDGVRRPVGWPEAMAEMASRFKAIQDAHGPESVAFLSTGQIATEEMALLGAVAKFGMAMATPASAWPPPSSPTSRRSGSTPRRTRIRTSRSLTASFSSARTSASHTRSCGSA